MDGLTMIATVIGHLAWPLAICFSVYILKGDLRGLLKSIRKIKYDKAEIDFGTELKAVSLAASSNKQLLSTDSSKSPLNTELAELSPRGAVIEAWLDVEGALYEFRERHGMESRSKKPFRLKELEQYKSDFYPIGEDTLGLLAMLKSLRNEAVHLQDASIGKKSALEYQQLAARVVDVIKSV